MDIYAWLLMLVLLVGVLGTFVPMLPGMWLVFAGLLVYGIFDKWTDYSVWYVVFVGILAVASSALDYAGSLLGAKKFGASNKSGFGAMAGSVIGGILGNLPGTIIGSALGAVGAEYSQKHSWEDAVRAASGTLIGSAFVSFIEFVVAVIIFIISFICVWGGAA